MSVFNDRLKTALHSAVTEFNQTSDPNGAVVKAAKDHGFTAEQTLRLIETFNTARTIFHYKSASDRTQQFALAEREQILPKLFDADKVTEKAASATTHSAYDAREQDYHDEAQAIKQADLPPLVETGLTLDQVSAQAMRALRTQRQMAKAAADEARLASNQAAVVLTKLAALLSHGYPDILQDQYARIVAGFGSDPECAPVVAKLAEFVPVCHKAPAALIEAYKRAHVIDDRDLHQHYTLLKEARDWMCAESEMLALADSVEKDANEFECEFGGTLGEILPKAAEASLANFFIQPVTKVGSTTTTSTTQSLSGANFFGEPVQIERKSVRGGETEKPGLLDSITGSVGNAVQKPFNSFMETGVQRSFSGPAERENKEVSDRLRNVQRQIMMQDLMTNDPVLSDESPEIVADAYNALMQLAPEVSTNKEVVRAILRQTVHSVAVSPYDAEVLTKLERNLLNIRGKPVGGGGGGGDEGGGGGGRR